MQNRYIGEPREPFARISLVPVVGVVIVLACLFLAAGTSARTMSVAVPQPLACCVCITADPLDVVVDANGAVQVNDEPVTDEALQAHLFEWHERSPNSSVNFVIDADVRHDRVLALVSYAEQAQIAGLAFNRPLPKRTAAAARR